MTTDKNGCLICAANHYCPEHNPETAEAKMPQFTTFPMMLNLSGNLVEIGDVRPNSPGFCIERLDGSVITVTGLTRAEVQKLDLFADVVLSVSAINSY
jgi:hypothetical protein